MIVFIFLIPYTASVYNGLSRLFNMAFQIESEGAYKIIIIVMALLTAIYVILGGYAATAINDFIQGIVMLVGIAAVVICAIHNRGGMTAALAALGDIEVNGKTNTLNSVFGPDPLNLLGVVVLTSLGTWGLPQMVQKFYAIKSENDIKKGCCDLHRLCTDRCRRFLSAGRFRPAVLHAERRRQRQDSDLHPVQRQAGF